MKTLILKTFPASDTGALGEKIITGFRSQIQHHLPSAQIDICALADDEPVPDPYQYDLIILTGGTFDLLTREPTPWVESTIKLVSQLASDTQSKQPKLLGICWGHQIIQKALGGELGAVTEGPRIGVEQLQLTVKGKEFFNKDNLLLHKFHKRQVTSHAQSFIPLAPSNEILLSSSGTMLSFQSHPEMSGEISQGLLDSDDKGFYTEKAAPNPNIVIKDINSSHDGEYVWGKIINWVKA